MFIVTTNGSIVNMNAVKKVCIDNKNYYETYVMADDTVLGCYEYRRAQELKNEIYEHLTEPTRIAPNLMQSGYEIVEKVYKMPKD